MGKGEERLAKVERLLRSGELCFGICAGKDCARSGAKHIIRAVYAALDEAGRDGAPPVALTKCQDYCDDGPAMTVAPAGLPYVELSPAAAREVVLAHVREGRPVPRFLHKKARRRLLRAVGAED
jgi:(2Fe-2S) ferredoxin